MMKVVLIVSVLAGMVGVIGSAASQEAAQGNTAEITGTGTFCLETAVKHALHCEYWSMDQCQKDAKASNLLCVPTPRSRD